ncbi:hypothetical protein HQ531_01820 [bacterium]|nr:hypothetical protein [bacterium]
MMRRHILIFSMLFVCLYSQQSDNLLDKSKIAFTPHNFLGTQKLGQTNSIVYDFSLCRQCHIPSKMEAVEALWYRKRTFQAFDMNKHVQAKESEVIPGDKNSRMCLACHDGRLAKGFPHHQNPQNPQLTMQSKNSIRSAKNSNLHLFNFPNNKANTHKPLVDSDLQLSDEGQISCVTCHNPHNNEFGNFLRVTPNGSQICFNCHEMTNWNLSTHGHPADPKYAKLLNGACAHCHDIHAVPAGAKLLKTDENTLCLSCHDGMQDNDLEVASESDLEAVFEKPFSHPIQWRSVAGNAVNGFDIWTAGIADERSVICSDCHNPHAASDQAISPFLDGAQLYVDGVDSRGFPKDYVDFEYETCYKCHGMNQNSSLNRSVGRLFAHTNMSFHPVEAPGNNPYVPSLKSEFSEQSMIRCTDCHGNEDLMGPQGPHGSNIPHILKASYADFPYSDIEENQLCFRCHEEQRVVQSNGFKFHLLHIQDAGYGCSACHNPHGSVEYPGLMDLSSGFIQPVNGVLEVVQTEPGHGYCTLKCHDKTHPGQTY